jgi:hypothetical protein
MLCRSGTIRNPALPTNPGSNILKTSPCMATGSGSSQISGGPRTRVSIFENQNDPTCNRRRTCGGHAQQGVECPLTLDALAGAFVGPSRRPFPTAHCLNMGETSFKPARSARHSFLLHGTSCLPRFKTVAHAPALQTCLSFQRYNRSQCGPHAPVFSPAPPRLPILLAKARYAPDTTETDH